MDVYIGYADYAREIVSLSNIKMTSPIYIPKRRKLKGYLKWRSKK
jgi:hypothetical protein